MVWWWLVIAVGYYPLWLAYHANRRTSLRDAVLWAVLAWTSWGPALHGGVSPVGVYVALCLTACAGVAVLGARRPHVFAWNFVVLGLLAVMLLPTVEHWLIGAQSFDSVRVCFLAATLVIGIGNYIPTRYGFVALCLLIGCAAWIWELFAVHSAEMRSLIGMAAFVAMSLVAAMMPSPGPARPFDDEWLRFRDRFGFLWGSRTLDQFNNAATNGGLPFRLEWTGLTSTGKSTEADLAAALTILRGLAKRFEEIG